ncbi:MAG TPA: AAA family ATPase [Ilumatobacteraceae bacterium]|nr:AAA family ATPase [Ilumatobacteraceae bacterium]
MPAATMTGRRDALDDVDDIAARVQADRISASAHIVGDPGIGKSVLLADAADHLRERGFTLLVTGLTAAEMPLVWAGLHGLLDGPVPDAAFGALPPAQRRAIDRALGRLPDDADRAAVVEPGLTAMAFAGVLERLTEVAPVAIVIDDVHWLDAATAGVVAFGMRANRDRPVLLVTAARPATPVHLEPARLVDADRHTEVGLDGLTVAATQDLLSTRFGLTLRRPELLRLHELTGGNPLHVIEIGRSLAAGGSIDDAARAITLRQTIEDRFGQLEPAVAQALGMCALLASPRLDVLGRAAGADLSPELAVAEHHGVVEVVGADVRFTHPLMRSVLLDRLGGAKRRSLQLRLAANVDDDDERALLLGAAATGPDPEIAQQLEDAARRAQLAGAVAIAAERMVRCIALTPGDDPLLVDRYLNCSEWMIASGDAVGSFDAARRAAELAGNRRERAAAGLAQIVPTARSSVFEASALADDLIVEFADETELLVPILLLAAQVKLRFDLAPTVELAKRALTATEPSSAAHRAARELIDVVEFLMGEPSDDGQRSAPTSADQTGAGETAGSVLPLVWADRHDEAIALVVVRIEADEARGNVVAANNIRDQLFDAYWRSGRWAEAEREMVRWRDLERTFGNELSQAPQLLDYAVLLAATGRSEQAAEIVSIVQPSIDQLAPTLECHARAALAAIAVVEQRWHDAVEHGRRARAMGASIGLRDVGALPYHLDLVEALVRVGEVDEADDVAAEHVRNARRAGRLRGLVESAHSRAIVDAARGDLDQAFEAFEQALAVDGVATIPLAHARVLLSLGAVLRRAGRRARSVAALDQADELFEQLGANAWRRRLADERSRSTARPTPSTLTPTQIRIADLVAKGHTNAMIASELAISVRTVESNLTSTYRRLGVRSRTGLIAWLSSPERSLTADHA